jgi:glutathione synthase/RimK-type ligase-like ATP-grasp enzyme
MKSKHEGEIILVLASRDDIHADSIISHCNDLKKKTIRIDTEDFWPQRSVINWKVGQSNSTATLTWLGNKVSSENVSAIYCRDFVFAKCPPEDDINSHLIYAESKAALYGFFRSLENRYWMNPPWYDEMADNKPFQMECARNIGLKIPPTLITNDPHAFKAFYSECNENVIIKQLSEICLIDDSEIQKAEAVEGIDGTAYGFYTKRVLPEHLDQIDEIISTPCLFQEHIKKKADIRVTVVENSCFSVRIDSQTNSESEVDFRHVIDLPMEPYQLPENITNKLLKLIRSWSLKFAACDFVLNTDDELVFIEANVEGNWLWMEKELDIPISQTIARYLVSH